MVMKNYPYLIFIPIVAGVVVMLITGGFASRSTNGQIQSNITSTICNSDGACITSVCINNQPCKTFSSNSSSSNNNDNSTDNYNGEPDVIGPQEQTA